MEVGAVPVIIADDIELPLGPDWETFALRVAERDIDTVPRLIERWEDRAGAMGSLARQAWERYFSPQATFGSVAGWGLRLLATPVKRPAALWFEEHSNPRRWLARLRRAKRSRLRSAQLLSLREQSVSLQKQLIRRRERFISRRERSGSRRDPLIS
jgi:hypothetical protein